MVGPQEVRIQSWTIKRMPRLSRDPGPTAHKQSTAQVLIKSQHTMKKDIFMKVISPSFNTHFYCM